MASRENQGLQIALIIFVMLTIILSVTTFIFFRWYNEQLTRADAAVKASVKDKSDANIAKDESTELKRLMGAGEQDSKDKVTALQKADMDKYGNKYPEAERNYHKVLEHLSIDLASANTRLIDSAARVTTLEGEIKTDRASTTAALAKYDTDLAKSRADLEGERAKFNDYRTKLTHQNEELAQQLEERRKQFEQATKASADQIAKVNTENKNLHSLIEGLKIKARQTEIASEIPDGKVTWCDQRSRLVWLDLGSADGLKTLTTFSVVDSQESNPAKAEKKASIEVTQVLSQHLSEARIVSDTYSNPILPGDRIFSPVFQPGRVEHFALAGFMDLDGDGQSDRKRVRDAITGNGGVIDAEADDNGKVTGTMTVNTHYLVLGKGPEDEKLKKEVVEGFSKLVGQATSLPVKTIAFHEFLDQMGYKADEHAVPLGKAGKASDFKPTFPNGVQPKSQTFRFEPRPTPTRGPKSAY